MRGSRIFLVVAEDAERLSLVSTTLHRKFPNSAVLTCRESEPAVTVARGQRLDAIVINTSTDLDELPLVECLRAACEAPILLLSAKDLNEKSRAAGATRFLHVQQWLLIGTSVAELIGAHVGGI